MFYFNISLPLPFSKASKDKSFFWFHKAVGKNRTFEIQFDKWGSIHSLLEIELKIELKGSDHAGPSFKFTLFNYSLNTSFYDNRHWNNEHNRWNTEEDDKAEADTWRNVNHGTQIINETS